MAGFSVRVSVQTTERGFFRCSAGMDRTASFVGPNPIRPIVGPNSVRPWTSAAGPHGYAAESHSAGRRAEQRSARPKALRPYITAEAHQPGARSTRDFENLVSQ